MKHKGVVTTYTCGGRCIESYILAGTMDEAEKLRVERNIGELITSGIIDVEVLPDHGKLSNEEFISQLQAVRKQALFLTYLSLASGKLNLVTALGCTSVLAKIFEIPGVNVPIEIIEAVRKDVQWLQSIVPGVFPGREAQQGKRITVKVKPGQHVTVRNIVPGSEVNNFGPAAITIWDCDTDPVPVAIGSTISDTDEPCGYHQTIEARAKGVIETNKDFVHLVNRDEQHGTSVQLYVKDEGC